MSNKKVYLDNAASTPIDKKVAAEMAQAVKLYGNPSSYNDCGREAREYVEKARLKVARFLGAHNDEVVFTSSGTEANNLAIFGIAKNLLRYCATALQPKNKPHIITTRIEHPSVLEPVRQLERGGIDVTYLSVDKEGFVNLDELKSSLRPETILVSVMYANNEIGTIQPITEIGKLLTDFRNQKLETPVPEQSMVRGTANSKLKIQNSKRLEFRILDLEFHEKFPIFHVDACQATEYLDINTNRLGVDLLTLNGSKIYGPKGVGVLYVRRGVRIFPIMLGGEQERGLKAGTENLMTIGGLAAALDKIDTHSTGSTSSPQASSGQEKEGKRLADLRDYFIEKISTLLPNVKINGPFFAKASKGKALGDKRLSNNVNISVPDLTSEMLLLELDKYGICAGSGSACTSHAVEPSHVLKAIEVGPRYINGAIRFSMGRQTTKKDIDYVLKALPKIIKYLKKRYKKFDQAVDF